MSNAADILELKQAIAHNLKIGYWNPSNQDIYLMAVYITEQNQEPTTEELFKLVKKYYKGILLHSANEGIDNSDLITILNLATKVKR